MTEEKLLQFFSRHQIKASLNQYKAGSLTISYAVVGEDHLPALLFIHGAPASMKMYKNYFTDTQLLNRFSIYAVDRPGYGITGGRAEASLQKAAEQILPLAQRIHRVHQPLIIVAGSYGASIACRMVMDHPGIVSGLVLVSASVGPGLEPGLNFLASLGKGRFHQLLSREIQSAITEKIHHKKELQKMKPFWKNITIPVFMLHSRKDPVIYTSNTVFARQELVNAPLVNIELVDGFRHNLHASKAIVVREKILALYSLLKN